MPKLFIFDAFTLLIREKTVANLIVSWNVLKIFMTIGCRELLLLSMTVSMGMLIFAGLGYALEKDEPDTMFYTLPQVGTMFKACFIKSH